MDIYTLSHLAQKIKFSRILNQLELLLLFLRNSYLYVFKG